MPDSRLGQSVASLRVWHVVRYTDQVTGRQHREEWPTPEAARQRYEALSKTAFAVDVRMGDVDA